MLLNKDRNTNSILEIKLVCFKLEVVWVICFIYLFFYSLLILDKFSKSLIILKKEFHVFGSFPPKSEHLKKKKTAL